MAGQNEIAGFAAEQAQVIVGGAVGAGLRLYLRPAGSMFRASITGVLCVASASVFGPSAQAWIPLNQAGCGAAVAFVTLTVAESILKSIERFDFGAFLKGKKE